MIEVVSAVIIRDGRILLTQRPAEKDFAFAWECPGGKVDGNESHHAALTRELREELGAKVKQIAMTSIWCGEFNNLVVRSERASIFLLMYRVILDDDDPAPLPQEGQGIGWFTAEEMERLTLAPGNVAALKEIQRALRSDVSAREKLAEIAAQENDT